MRSPVAELILLVCLGVTSVETQTQARKQLPFQNNNANFVPAYGLSPGPEGSNNATYGPKPKSGQLFEIEYLEVAPSPFLV